MRLFYTNWSFYKQLPSSSLTSWNRLPNAEEEEEEAVKQHGFTCCQNALRLGREQSGLWTAVHRVSSRWPLDYITGQYHNYRWTIMHYVFYIIAFQRRHLHPHYLRCWSTPLPRRMLELQHLMSGRRQWYTKHHTIASEGFLIKRRNNNCNFADT